MSVVSFVYIVYELLICLSVATNSETDAVIRGKIQTASVRVSAVKAQYQSAVLISGSITFISFSIPLIVYGELVVTGAHTLSSTPSQLGGT